MFNKLYFIITFLFLTVTTTSYAETKIPLSVMTFNIENGGTQVSFDNVVLAIKKSGADIVGIQEAWGNSKRLAQALGWKYVDPGQHILSKFPLYTFKSNQHLFDLVEVKSGYFVALANIHLPDDPYGPDLVKSGMSSEEVIKNEYHTRLPTAKPYIDALSSLIQNGTPVFLTGDFNSPSNLDWTAHTSQVLRNHRYSVNWPVTAYAEKMGLTDSYRVIHSDPLKKTGYTWPAMRPALKQAIDGFNPSQQDLSDRIDFIFYGGNVKVMGSSVIGESKSSALTITPWPSDHRAVISRFEVTPAPISRKQLQAIDNADRFHLRPTIKVSQSIYSPGEPIWITWTNAPGNRFDYVSIYPDNKSTTSMEDAVRLYLFGKRDGTVKLDASTSRGNLTSWYKTDKTHWPLQTGNYVIKLMLDDSNIPLASGYLKVSNRYQDAQDGLRVPMIEGV